MPTAEFFRATARQCRELLAIAKVPEVIAQLELWIREFEEAATRAEMMAVVHVRRHAEVNSGELENLTALRDFNPPPLHARFKDHLQKL